MTDLPPDAKQVLEQFQDHTGLTGLSAQVKERSGDRILVIDIAPIERFYETLQKTLEPLKDINEFANHVSLHRSEVRNWLTRPEVQLFQKVLSESLTIGQQNLNEDFFERYIPSGTGYEDAVISKANHLVCGRRGTGKSSLLLYAFGKLQGKANCVWLSMQQFEGRSDWQCAAQVFDRLAIELGSRIPATLASRLSELAASQDTTEADVRRVVPDVNAAIRRIAGPGSPLHFFLDDFHVLDPKFQPSLCSVVYGCCRDNSAFIKLSGVERFTHLWDSSTAVGLQEGQDIQKLSLDYNLESVETARSHIEEILNKQARYCGIDSIRSLCEASVIDRLVWLAAGVPRDAIAAFSKAIAQSRLTKSRSVTLTSLNTVASLNTDEKVRAAKVDAQSESEAALTLLETVKTFCIQTQKKNAFLVRVDEDHPKYQRLLQLVDLRLLHVLHRGLTPDRAAERYAAFLLDYGFYVGTRTARSVDLFHKQAANPGAKTLRRLPRFSLSDAPTANVNRRSKQTKAVKAKPVQRAPRSKGPLKSPPARGKKSVRRKGTRRRAKSSDQK